MSTFCYFSTNRTLADGTPVLRRWSKSARNTAFVVRDDSGERVWRRVCKYCDNEHHGHGMCSDHYRHEVVRGEILQRRLTLIDPEDSEGTSVILLGDDQRLLVFRDKNEWRDWAAMNEVEPEEKEKNHKTDVSIHSMCCGHGIEFILAGVSTTRAVAFDLPSLVDDYLEVFESDENASAQHRMLVFALSKLRVETDRAIEKALRAYRGEANDGSSR